MDLRLFLSVLLVYRSNFHLLHWKAYGKEFDMIHELSAKYYDKLLEDADVVAEKAMIIDMNPVNYIEAYELLQESESQFKILTSDTAYGFNEFIENVSIMFGDILKCIEQLLDGELTIGTKAALESMYEYYELQLKYINKHRSGESTTSSDEEDNQDIDAVENNDTDDDTEDEE